MAQTCTGLTSVIYDICIDDYAAEFADMMHGGSRFMCLLLQRPFDEEKWQAAFEDFKARVDTGEKLMDWALALHEAGA